MSDKVKLEYFPIAGAGEKVRLALVLTGTPFDDVRIPFSEWGERKKTAKYGQLPILTMVDGQEVYQSEAMLRWAAAQAADGGAALLGATAAQQLRVNEVLGLALDFHREWSPCIYLGMDPARYGHAEDVDKGALCASLRGAWLAPGGGMEKFMNYFTTLLATNGCEGGDGFLCGSVPTIADLDMWPRLTYFTKGIADHVPADSLERYPEIVAYVARMAAWPPIADYYASKDQ